MKHLMATQVRERQPINKVSVAALVVSLLSLAGMVYLSMAGLAVFAVGLGHLAWTQLDEHPQNGRICAVIALSIGYGIGLLSLFGALLSLPTVFTQLS